MLFILVLLVGVACAAKPRFVGTALAGGEFGTAGEPLVPFPYPGVYEEDYIYPEGSEADYFARKGMNTFRIPFLWERLQKSLNSPISSTELERLKETVDDITDRVTGYVILDLHNYNRYRGEIIGVDASVSNQDLVDLWKAVAFVFLDNPRVMFGIMNEPYQQPVDSWVETANAVIEGIRAIGASQPVLVCGMRWSTGYTWGWSDTYGEANSVAMLQIQDPANSVIFEIHQYLDEDNSGQDTTCVSPTIGSERLGTVTDWLREHSLQGLIAEFGAPHTETCMAAVTDMLEFVENNTDVWLGWTWWAAGEWFEGYPLSIQKHDGTDAEQMPYLEPFLLAPLSFKSSSSSIDTSKIVLAVLGTVVVLGCMTRVCRRSKNLKPLP